MFARTLKTLDIYLNTVVKTYPSKETTSWIKRKDLHDYFISDYLLVGKCSNSLHASMVLHYTAKVRAGRFQTLSRFV